MSAVLLDDFKDCKYPFQLAYLQTMALFYSKDKQGGLEIINSQLYRTGLFQKSVLVGKIALFSNITYNKMFKLRNSLIFFT